MARSTNAKHPQDSGAPTKHTQHVGASTRKDTQHSRVLTRDFASLETALNIAHDGDLVIRLDDEQKDVSYFYRVSTSILRNTDSSYFKVLLDPNKFSEGREVAGRLDKVQEQEHNGGAIPITTLPMVCVGDFEDLPRNVYVQSLFASFLLLLHGFTKNGHPHLVDLLNTRTMAMLVIIADRFDATKPLKQLLALRPAWRLKTWPMNISRLQREVFYRQNLLIGLLLRFPDMVQKWSTEIIVMPLPSTEGNDNPNSAERGALWWDLPDGIEGISQVYLDHHYGGGL